MTGRDLVNLITRQIKLEALIKSLWINGESVQGRLGWYYSNIFGISQYFWVAKFVVGELCPEH